jgi:hypothetical protein
MRHDANLSPTAKGSTNTHLAVVWAIRRMACRREARKILIVTTDGDPGDLETHFEFRHSATVMGLVADGDGTGVVPRLAVRPCPGRSG